jgi:ubiquinone/menaquinone biosynthesis C-methylase UbiE
VQQEHRCPVCNSTDHDLVAAAPDELALQAKPFELIHCANCAIMYTHPHLDVEAVAPYYASGYWYYVAQDIHPIMAFIKKMEQQFIFAQVRWETRIIKQWLPSNAKLLDVGCSTGVILQVLDRAGFDVYGVEVSEEATIQAQAIFGDKIRQGTIEDSQFSGNYFDGVTFIHVLEHVQNPKTTLQETHRIMKPGGMLLIEVPNVESLGFHLFGLRWMGLQMPRHLYHFSDQSLTTLLEECGFVVEYRSFYSVRVSSPIYVIGLFPFLDPARLREESNTNPLLSFLYLILYLVFIPIAVLASRPQRGEVLRFIASKSNDSA